MLQIGGQRAQAHASLAAERLHGISIAVGHPCQLFCARIAISHILEYNTCGKCVQELC